MAARSEPLSEYNRRRDFSKTREPKGAVARTHPGQKRFLVQKHDATRLHYDFRLEWEGVLKSWAVTRGPSLNPEDKRLAIRTEDHPLAYGDFEGTIPEGEYGGGTVMLWDTGWWEPEDDPEKGLKKGKLAFRLHGSRMKGGWALVRMRPRDGEKRESWLLVKQDDDVASEDGESLIKQHVVSARTGRTMDEIAEGRGEKRARVWHSNKSTAANLNAGAVSQDEGRSKRRARKSSVKPPAFRPPQLATLVTKAPAGDDWLNEAKFDGYRLIAAVGGGIARCYTRNGLDWTEKFPTIAAALAELDCDSALIDGEVVALADQGSNFSALQKALRTGASMRFYAFDLIELDEKDLSRRPLVERKEKLAALLDSLGTTATIQYSEHVRGNGEHILAAICKAGQEGIIAKEAKAPYRSGRTRSWLKVKCTKRQEFVIGGYTPSTKKGRAFASLLLGTFEGGKLIYRGGVGTGFGEKVMEELAAAFAKRQRPTSPFDQVPRERSRDAVWLKPDLVAEVDFAEFTADGHIRHGSFEGLREDREAKTVKLETAKPTDAEPGAAKGKSSAKTRTASPTKGDADILGVHISHPDRILFEGQGITKIDLARYYAVVAERMLPFAADHPVSLVRCPQGGQRQCFFQKHANEGFPEAIREVPITESSGETENYMYVHDAKGLVAAVQMGTLEFHIWGATIDRLEKPDRLVFDLDPDPSVDFATVKAAATTLRDELAEIGLKTVAMVTGGKGVHVIVPLRPHAEWDEAKGFAKRLAQTFAERDPEHFVATMSKAKRKGRIFIDWLRNDRGATAIAPYSTRARAGGPVATPVSWDELEALDAANTFHIADIIERIEAGTDPWREIGEIKQSLTKKMLNSTIS
ncbi:bifunctional non-homologous end joining protein LigD [Sinorhizobium fredii]|uniref:DNA ligase (ATP) n=1 Tax=Sinorhizobium fredii (strain USDA 257) TaxID=1185652 RepID=I3XCX5_SINF2|nr:DNA ligase D [Sinorhizobium fredii]AFL53731.1 putative ATP-dependent DNA ligase YkoU [Sinorhizobium fredii USDA 257]